MEAREQYVARGQTHAKLRAYRRQTRRQRAGRRPAVHRKGRRERRLRIALQPQRQKVDVLVRLRVDSHKINLLRFPQSTDEQTIFDFGAVLERQHVFGSERNIAIADLCIHRSGLIALRWVFTQLEALGGVFHTTRNAITIRADRSENAPPTIC